MELLLAFQGSMSAANVLALYFEVKSRLHLQICHRSPSLRVHACMYAMYV